MRVNRIKYLLLGNSKFPVKQFVSYTGAHTEDKIANIADTYVVKKKKKAFTISEILK